MVKSYMEDKKMNKTIMPIILIIISLCFPYIILGDSTSSNMEITFDPDPIIVTAGNKAYVNLILTNIGNSKLESIDLEATTSDWEIIPENDWDIRVGGLSTGHSLSLLFTFRVASGASSDFYSIDFIVRALDAGIVSRSNVIFVEESSTLDIVNVEPDVINIGMINKMTFTIANNGEDTFNNILMYWEDTDNYILPSGSDNRLIISSIKPENTSEISFDVIVNPALTPGVYPLFITIEYYDKTGTKQSISSEIGLQISGGTNFDIVLQDSTGGGTTLAIANTGSNIASSVIVSIPIQPNFNVNGVTSRSLGNLDAGDYTLATFQISSVKLNDSKKPEKYNWEKPSDVNNSKSKDFLDSKVGANNLIVEISYTDLFGVRQTVKKEVDFSSSTSNDKSDFSSKSDFSGKLDSYDKSSGLDNGTLYIIIGVVGIIAIITLLQIGKRKKK